MPGIQGVEDSEETAWSLILPSKTVTVFPELWTSWEKPRWSIFQLRARGAEPATQMR
jgi:hypothetical protein